MALFRSLIWKSVNLNSKFNHSKLLRHNIIYNHRESSKAKSNLNVKYKSSFLISTSSTLEFDSSGIKKLIRSSPTSNQVQLYEEENSTIISKFDSEINKHLILWHRIPDFNEDDVIEILLRNGINEFVTFTKNVSTLLHIQHIHIYVKTLHDFNKIKDITFFNY